MSDDGWARVSLQLDEPAAVPDWNEVYPGHLLGSRPDDDWHMAPEAAQVGMVVCLERRQHWVADHKGPVLVFPMDDVDSSRYVTDREQLEAFVLAVEALSKVCPGKVLWHCQAGMNRSAFALATYLCAVHGLTPAMAIDTVRKRSKWCLSNRAFLTAIAQRYGVRA